jgi:integrase/recombinase XerD
MTDLIPAIALSPAVQAAPERLAGVLAAFWTTLESAHSRRAYFEDWGRFAAHLGTLNVYPLAAKVEHVAGHMEGMRVRGLARSTRARALTVLREVYSAVYRAGLRADNPAREVKLPRVQREPNTPWLTEAQLVALLRPCGDSWVERRDRLVLLMLLGLGLRRSSVAGTHVDHLVRWTDGRLGIRVLAKGGKEADLLLPSWLAKEIEGWIAFSGVHGPLFPRLRRVGYNDMRPEMDRPIGAGKVWDVVKEGAARAGIDPRQATPHGIRRSFVTIARARGVELADLQAALMHSQITTTERYDKAVRGMTSAPGDALADIYEAASLSTAPEGDQSK